MVYLPTDMNPYTEMLRCCWCGNAVCCRHCRSQLKCGQVWSAKDTTHWSVVIICLIAYEASWPKIGVLGQNRGIGGAILTP